ncbi:TPA: TRAP transporter substrate-binding protein [Aeromonas sobria]|jgi:tripartite ATP-independent transporter DctP family solute receptor|nr:TRAP transporter substrate-binding protein [Aeromonas sobria]
MNYKKTLSAVAVFSFLFSGAVHAAQVIKIGHFMSDTHPQSVALTNYFKKIVEDKTQGRYEIRIYPNNQLGGEEQVLNGVRRGTIEGGVVGLLMQNTNPIFGIWEWPFLFKDNQEAKKILTQSDVAKDIREKYQEYGVKVLATGVNGFRVTSSNVRVAEFKDFKGLRLRVPNNDMFVTWGKAMGANPQAMPLSEVFTALEQKVIDGQENPYSLLKESGLYEVQKYIVETNHSFSPGMLMFSLKTWNKMSPEDQAIFQEAANVFQEKEWELAISAEKENKDFLKNKGLEIIYPDEKFSQDMRTAAKPIYDNYYNTYNWAKPMIESINLAKNTD